MADNQVKCCVNVGLDSRDAIDALLIQAIILHFGDEFRERSDVSRVGDDQILEGVLAYTIVGTHDQLSAGEGDGADGES